MDADAGFTTPNLAEAETNRALIAAADQVVICADSTKWGTRGLASFAPLTAADILITDDSLSDDAHAVLADQIGTITIVTSERHRHAETR